MPTEPEATNSKEERSSKFNLNTLLASIALAVIFWVGSKTQSTSESVAKIETALPYMNASVMDLKDRIGQLVTRSELETRFAQAEARNAVLEARLLKVETVVEKSK